MVEGSYLAVTAAQAQQHLVSTLLGFNTFCVSLSIEQPLIQHFNILQIVKIKYC